MGVNTLGLSHSMSPQSHCPAEWPLKDMCLQLTPIMCLLLWKGLWEA